MFKFQLILARPFLVESAGWRPDRSCWSAMGHDYCDTSLTIKAIYGRPAYILNCIYLLSNIDCLEAVSWRVISLAFALTVGFDGHSGKQVIGNCTLSVAELNAA